METRFSTRELAQMLGVSHQHILYILRGERKPSPAMAERLETVTGIRREAWIWPEKYGNAYVEAHEQERRNAS